MGRPPKFTSDRILDTALLLLASGGQGSLTVAAIADRLGAPSGSIYHRFGSRDILVASLWLRSVDRFQEALAPSLGVDDVSEAIRRIAVGVVQWTRTNPLEAEILLLYRSSDLLRSGWPAEMTERNLAQRARIAEMVDSLSQRVGGTTTSTRCRVSFAAIDIPYAAVRPWLRSGTAPPDDVDSIVIDAVNGVLAGLDTLRKDHQ